MSYSTPLFNSNSRSSGGGTCKMLGENGGSIVVTNPKDTSKVYYSNKLIVDESEITINSDIAPLANTSYNLGSFGRRWNKAFIGSGGLNIAGPLGSIRGASLGGDREGLAYSEFGFASSFINVGSSAFAPRAAGGWKISPLGLQSDPNYDIVAQQIDPITGLPIGPV